MGTIRDVGAPYWVRQSVHRLLNLGRGKLDQGRGTPQGSRGVDTHVGVQLIC